MHAEHSWRLAGFSMVLFFAACGPTPMDSVFDTPTDSDAIRGGVRPCQTSTQSDCCGNATCDERESCSTCAADCGSCSLPTPTGGLGEGCNPDGSCDADLRCDAGVCVAQVVDPCDGVTCSGHGTCVVADVANCACDAGYVADGMSCTPVSRPETADCGPIAARWEVCAADSTTCTAVFRDGAGCQALCAAAGLDCLAVYEDVSGSCAPNLSLPALSCDTATGHGSDYCVCGNAGPCVSQCAGRECGDDGCGGSCGTCAAGHLCQEPSRVCALPEAEPLDLGPLAAFPHAEGFGAASVGGRGGAIYKVTNLNDSGAGSFRAAVTASGPRVVVFEVSGRIKLLTALSISNPYITIAGQTAPAPGIQITDRMLGIRTHNVVIQHLRVRVGDEGKTVGGWDSQDSFQPYGTNLVILDHVTANWSIDEILGVQGNNTNLSITNSMFAEALNCSVHTKGCHGYGVLLSLSSNVSMMKNLISHVTARMPRVAQGSYYFTNNLMYHTAVATGSAYSAIGGSEPNDTITLSLIGNYWQAQSGTGTAGGSCLAGAVVAGSKIFAAGNITPSGVELNSNCNAFRVSSPVAAPPGHTPVSATEARTHVLAHAGARPRERDAVETRIIGDVVNRTGSVIDSQEEVGGFPVYPQNSRAFSVPASPWADDDHNGWSNLEEILYQMHLALVP